MSQTKVGQPQRAPGRGGVAALPARERILAAATRMFYHQGITNTGIDAVIESAGVAKMSLYRHFGSKDQLIVECLARLDTRYHNWFVEQVENHDVEPTERVLSVFDVLDEWFHDDHFRGCAFINATVELADRSHPARQPAMAHKRRNREYVEQLVERADLPDPPVLARQIMLLIEGAIVTALVQEDLDAALDAKDVARHLLEAVCARPRR
ncbi:TetR/AcrR family transcriptional regulator [Leekyejoonella antrihumi]|uniref:TetR/AcrR family transcriptional regulator n=1 Tax=Leekyejoonella antrihumi TaxID=1660198 RepID=A0A563E4X2_9MICO|nr:TetR/AcrR family transcriptional regulator [Leekyejoonella antrihumi]TWP37587.1 TetR/AcrR family transcriptional regulator [Leekyejoonella antrihumi]